MDMTDQQVEHLLRLLIEWGQNKPSGFRTALEGVNLFLSEFKEEQKTDGACILNGMAHLNGHVRDDSDSVELLIKFHLPRELTPLGKHRARNREFFRPGEPAVVAQ